MNTAYEIQMKLAQGNRLIASVNAHYANIIRGLYHHVYLDNLMHIALDNIKRMEAEGMTRVDRILFGEDLRERHLRMAMDELQEQQWLPQEMERFRVSGHAPLVINTFGGRQFEYG